MYENVSLFFCTKYAFFSDNFLCFWKKSVKSNGQNNISLGLTGFTHSLHTWCWRWWTHQVRLQSRVWFTLKFELFFYLFCFVSFIAQDLDPGYASVLEIEPRIYETKDNWIIGLLTIFRFSICLLKKIVLELFV